MLSGLLVVSKTGQLEEALFKFQDARNVMSFVDGHASFIKIYWNGTQGPDGFTVFYEPPAGYEYKWSGN